MCLINSEAGCAKKTSNINVYQYGVAPCAREREIQARSQHVRLKFLEHCVILLQTRIYGCGLPIHSDPMWT